MLSSLKKRKIEREADATPEVVKKHRKESKMEKVKDSMSENKATQHSAPEITIPPPTEKSIELDVEDDEKAGEEVVPKSFKDLVFIPGVVFTDWS